MPGVGVQEDAARPLPGCAGRRSATGRRRRPWPRKSGWVQTPLSSVKPSSCSRSPAMAISRPSRRTPMKRPSSCVRSRNGPAWSGSPAPASPAASASVSGLESRDRRPPGRQGGADHLHAGDAAGDLDARQASTIGPSSSSTSPAPGWRGPERGQAPHGFRRAASAAATKTPTAGSSRTARRRCRRSPEPTAGWSGRSRRRGRAGGSWRRFSARGSAPSVPATTPGPKTAVTPARSRRSS